MPKASRDTEELTQQEELLDMLSRAGRHYLELGDAVAAGQTFRRLLSAALEHDTDAAREAEQQAMDGLGDCLAALKYKPEARSTLLEALFQAYRAAAERGADGLGQDAAFAMLRHTTPEERRQLAAWARRELAAQPGGAAAEHYWRLLLDLEALQPASPEAAFAQCRAAGHAELVAQKLLDLDRVGEALTLARHELREPAQLLRFADSPAARTQVRAVMAMVEERLAQCLDPHLADWLATRYAERGDLARALDVRLKLLRTAPGNGNYEAVQALARRLGRWERLQPQVSRIAQQGRRG